MDDLYSKIETLCKKHNTNITIMCKEAGVSRSPLSDLKMGRSKSLSSETLSKIASYFNVSVDYLLGKEVNDKLAAAEDNELAEILEDIRRNPDLRAMFSLTKNATPEQVRQYIDVIKAIRGEGKNE